MLTYLRRLGICLALGFTVNAIPIPLRHENIRYHPASRGINRGMIYPRIYDANPITENPTPTFVLGARATSADSDREALGFRPWTPPFPVRDSKRTEIVRGTLHPDVRGKHSAPLLRSEDIVLEERKLDLSREPKADVGMVKSKRPFSLVHNRNRRMGGG